MRFCYSLIPSKAAAFICFFGLGVLPIISQGWANECSNRCVFVQKACGERSCARLPQPPTDTPVSLEGENCICCLENKDMPSNGRNLNKNKDCQSYQAMCNLFRAPLNYPGIIRADQLFLVPNPSLSVPECQKIIFPPLVSNPLSLRNKHVLVIGGSKGIGKAVAERLASEGAFVIATSRHPECYESPRGYLLKKLDVRFEKDVKHFIEHVVSDCFNGRLDILVNCAAIAWRGPLSEATGDDILNVLETNLAGYHRATHYSLPFMRHSNETRVISFGSMEAYSLFGYNSGGYGISKLALQKWNDLLQVEELLKKSQGLVSFGPTFSLMEPYSLKTSQGLYEYYKASELSIKDPLVLGARLQTASRQNIFAETPQLAAEAVYRVAIAPQPGVRYAVVEPDAVVTFPDGSQIPVLAGIQLVNTLSQDDVINLFQILNQQIINDTQVLKEIAVESFGCNK